MPFYTSAVAAQTTGKSNAFISQTAMLAANGGSLATAGQPTATEFQAAVTAAGLNNTVAFYTGDDVEDHLAATLSGSVDSDGEVTLSSSSGESITTSDTTADASHTQDFATFGQTWNNMGPFDVNMTDGTLTVNVTNAVLPGAEGSLSVGLGSVVAKGETANPTGITGEVRLDGNKAELSGSDGTRQPSFSVDNAGDPTILGEAQIHIKTNAVVKGNATVGQIPVLVNATTGELEFADINTVDRNYSVKDETGSNGTGTLTPPNPDTATPDVGDVEEAIFDDVVIYFTAVAANWTAPAVIEIPRNVIDFAAATTAADDATGDGGTSSLAARADHKHAAQGVSADANNATITSTNDGLHHTPIAQDVDVLAGTAGKVLDASHVLDEDDMASDSDTQVPSQQSVKAYVDAKASGAWTMEDSADANLSLTDNVGDKFWRYNGSGAATWTLPVPNSYAPGARLIIMNQGSAQADMTVSSGQPTSGYLDGFGGNVASLTIKYGQIYTFVRMTAGAWAVTSVHGVEAASGDVVLNNSQTVATYSPTSWGAANPTANVMNLINSGTTSMSVTGLISGEYHLPAGEAAILRRIPESDSFYASQTRPAVVEPVPSGVIHKILGFDDLSVNTPPFQAGAIFGHNGLNDANWNAGGLYTPNDTLDGWVEVPVENGDIATETFTTAAYQKVTSGWVEIGIKQRLFLNDTVVSPAVAGQPTIGEIKDALGANDTGKIGIYTGTGLSSDPITHVYHIDANQNVTLLKSPSDSNATSETLDSLLYTHIETTPEFNIGSVTAGVTNATVVFGAAAIFTPNTTRGVILHNDQSGITWDGTEATIAKGGRYDVSLNFGFINNQTNQLAYVQLVRNGTEVLDTGFAEDNSGTSGRSYPVTLSWKGGLSAGDKIDIRTGTAGSQQLYVSRVVLGIDQLSSSSVVLPDALEVEDVGFFRVTANANNATNQGAGNLPMVIGNPTVEENIGGIASYNAGQITITAGQYPVELKAHIVTVGNQTGTVSMGYFFRDVADPIGQLFGSGTVDATSERGIFGDDSTMEPATARIPANTTVTLEVRQLNSQNFQVIQAGSYIEAREVRPQKTVINTTDMTVNDQASSGYMEFGVQLQQWSNDTSTGTTPKAVTFPTPFADTSYSLVVTPFSGGNGQTATVVARTTTGFSITTVDVNGTPQNNNFSWQAIGLKP